MQYLITPLHTHFDSGFGATGDAFRSAADKLESEQPGRGMLNGMLPVNYLRRHAIELYLKSAIVIIHRSLRLPYGGKAATGEPYALVSGEWKPFFKLHSVKELWTYLKTLFDDNRAFFDSIKTVDWTFPVEVDSWIDTVEERDPRSTFFRYPDLRDSSSDLAKAEMREGQPEEIMSRLRNRPDEKLFIVLMENEAREVVRAYYYDDNALKEFGRVLRDCSHHFFCLHAALRSEVCRGA